MPPPAQGLKPGSLKDPAVAALFSTKDPEARYDDLREIGHGSFGAVYFAFDKEKSETVAIKKMAFLGKQASEKWADIIKEVSFLNKIKHANIVQYKACFLKDQTCWLVMEYCIGSAADIVDVLRTGLKEVEIAAICCQTLDALHYLHSLKRIHRDVKAGNILLSDCGLVKLADFGSASLSSPAQTFIGTPFFMAPEVILAMDEGHYTEKADIWSLGITCIELAERRPPLFNMNAMSALYHIAQNEPPILATIDDPEQPPWSDKFQSFVEQCLRKDPDQRLSTGACMTHSFVTTPQSRDVIPELIIRTKTVVRELDNFQYKKMRKLMYLDEDRQGQDPDTNYDNDDTTTTGISVSSTGGDGLSVGPGGGGADSASSRSNSLASFRSIHSSGAPTSLGGLSSRQRPPIPDSMWPTKEREKQRQQSEENRTVINVGSGGSPSESVIDRLTPDVDTTTVGGNGNIERVNRESPPRRERNIKEDMATLRKSKFSTLRTTKLISKEQEEYSQENNVAEQMSGYKRLRQTHHKELQQLEEKCRTEMEVIRVKMDRDLENLNGTYSKERLRVKEAHNSEIHKKRKENDEGERKLRRQISQRHSAEAKKYVDVQEKEYKNRKELAKSDIKSRSSGQSRAIIDTRIKEVKGELQRQKSVAVQSHQMALKAEFDTEIRKYRKAALLRVHAVEEKLESDEMAIRERQMESKQSMLRNHHEQTRSLEIAELREIHVMKKKHQEAQHEAEYTNQTEYTRRLQDEQRKRHALMSKQQPRELKLKTEQIRKQYRQAVKTQTRQFKLWSNQMLANATREEQRDLSAKLKEDQKRKIALLSSQYDSQVENMVQEKTVKLESWQEEEVRELSEKLTRELDELKAYQQRQRAQLETQIQKERVALDDRISLRRAVLDQRLEEERAEMRRVREETDMQRKERHRRQLRELDEDVGTSTSL